LLDDAGNVCLTDFGLSTILAEVDDDSFKAPWGNLRWVAPELVMSDLKHMPTKAGDIYSFGCVMLQVRWFVMIPDRARIFLSWSKIFSGKFPYHEWMDWHQVIVAIMAGQEPFSGVEIKDEGHRILSSRCLSKEPEDRPSILAVTAILRL
jgi:serine/threonine protein kinase